MLLRLPAPSLTDRTLETGSKPDLQHLAPQGLQLHMVLTFKSAMISIHNTCSETQCTYPEHAIYQMISPTSLAVYLRSQAPINIS